MKSNSGVSSCATRSSYSGVLSASRGTRQVDDHRRATRPQRVELIDGVTWVAQHVVVDDNVGGAGPRLGRGALDSTMTPRPSAAGPGGLDTNRMVARSCDAIGKPAGTAGRVRSCRPCRPAPPAVSFPCSPCSLLGAGACSSSGSSKPTAQDLATTSTTPTTPTSVKAPAPIGHVFVINLENESYVDTWAPASPAVYLNKTLRPQGQLLTQYFGTAHASLGNYLA